MMNAASPRQQVVPLTSLNVDQSLVFLQHLGLPNRFIQWEKKDIRPLDGVFALTSEKGRRFNGFLPKKESA